MDYLGRLIEITLEAVFSTYGILGVIVTIVLVVMEYLKGGNQVIDSLKRPATVVAIVISVTFLIYAPYRAWKDENAMLAEEKEKNLSNLEGLIEQYNIELRTLLDPKAITKEVFVVFAQMSITNLGMPSIARAFQGTVESDQGILSGVQMVIDEGQVLNGAMNTRITLRVSDALFEKSEMVPIPTGGMTRGWLCFAFTDVLRERLTSPTAKLVISFQDARGHKYTNELSLKDHKKPYVLRHYSGGPEVQVMTK